MYFVRLKIQSQTTQHVTLFCFTGPISYSHYLSSDKRDDLLKSTEIKEIHGQLTNENTYTINAFIKFSQVHDKLVVIGYKLNNKMVYKQYYINKTNYKDKHIIKLDDCNWFNDPIICDYIKSIKIDY